MASYEFDNILEKGTTLSFGAWTFVEDGSGGFTSHLSDEESTKPPRHDDGPTQNNLSAQADSMPNLHEDPQEAQNFDLIKRYWTDPESPTQLRVDNSDLLDGIDRVMNKLSECVNIAQSTLHERNVHRDTPTNLEPLEK